MQVQGLCVFFRVCLIFIKINLRLFFASCFFSQLSTVAPLDSAPEVVPRSDARAATQIPAPDSSKTTPITSLIFKQALNSCYRLNHYDVIDVSGSLWLCTHSLRHSFEFIRLRSNILWCRKCKWKQRDENIYSHWQLKPMSLTTSFSLPITFPSHNLVRGQRNVTTTKRRMR